jgi:DNA polymerase III subunit beta
MMGTITVNRAELGKALDFASLGVSKRHLGRVMAGMLVTVGPEGLFLGAFDYETAACAAVNGRADGTGRVLVTGAELAAVVKSLPRGKNVTAEISVYPDGAVLICDGIEATLSSLPIDEYPQLPDLPEQAGLADAEAFTRSVQRVAVCAGTDDRLPALTGIKLSSDGGALELAATDRYRLAVDRVAWTGPDGTGTLIPTWALSAFAKRADKHGKVALHFGADHAGLSDGTRTLITRTIQGEYPKYRSWVDDSAAAATTVLVDAGTLEQAVTRAGKLTTWRDEPLHLDVTGDGLTVRVMRDGNVASSQPVPAAVDGDPMEVLFNPAYLASVLAGVDGEAFIGLGGPSKPAVITAAGGADGYTGACMTIKPA